MKWVSKKIPQTQEISFFIDAFFILKNKSTPKTQIRFLLSKSQKKKKKNKSYNIHHCSVGIFTLLLSLLLNWQPQKFFQNKINMNNKPLVPKPWCQLWILNSLFFSLILSHPRLFSKAQNFCFQKQELDLRKVQLTCPDPEIVRYSKFQQIY